MQIISYGFLILKHIQIDLQFWKILMLKVRLYFFFFFFFGGGGGDHRYSQWGMIHISRNEIALGGISSSVLSVFFTDKFALSQSDARISVAYNSCQWKTLTKRLMKCPPDVTHLWITSWVPGELRVSGGSAQMYHEIPEREFTSYKQPLSPIPCAWKFKIDNKLFI